MTMLTIAYRASNTLLMTVLALLVLGVAAPAPAQVNIAQLQAEIDRLKSDLKILTEEYNQHRHKYGEGLRAETTGPIIPCVPYHGRGCAGVP